MSRYTITTNEDWFVNRLQEGGVGVSDEGDLVDMCITRDYLVKDKHV